MRLTTREFPFVHDFADYHEIESARRGLNLVFLGSTVVQSQEITFHNGRYWGLFWIHGANPSEDQVQELLDDHGVPYEKRG